jgi:hypothetical protein
MKKKEKASIKEEESKGPIGPDLFKQSLESILNREVSDEETKELDEFLSGGLSDADNDEEVFPGPKQGE